MSGLKLVPRIPKWPSTAKGNEAARSATSATGQPLRNRFPRFLAPSREESARGDGQHQDHKSRNHPVPGNRTVPQHIAQSSASPTAGASHDQLLPPKSRSRPVRSPAKTRRPPPLLHRSRSRGREPRGRSYVEVHNAA